MAATAITVDLDSFPIIVWGKFLKLVCLFCEQILTVTEHHVNHDILVYKDRVLNSIINTN